MMPSKLNIVLYEPEIPQNTGNIARLCACCGASLYLVGKLGFSLSSKYTKRAGLDYWPYVDIKTHDTWESYLEENKDSRIWLISKFGTREYWDADFCESDSIVFGSETKGLGKPFLSKYDKSQILRIPMSCNHVRSLNLSM